MEASKLMLRNLFLEKNSREIIQIIGLKESTSMKQSDEIEFSGNFPEGWKAVSLPISDNLLFELGFKKDGPMYYHYNRKFRFFKNDHLGYHYWDHKKSEQAIKLNFIHEVQNVYFYYTNEHLSHNITGKIIYLEKNYFL